MDFKFYKIAIGIPEERCRVCNRIFRPISILILFLKLRRRGVSLE